MIKKQVVSLFLILSILLSTTPCIVMAEDTISNNELLSNDEIVLENKDDYSKYIAQYKSMMNHK